MSAVVPTLPVETGKAGKPSKSAGAGKSGKRHYGTHIFLIVMAAIWLIPLVWSLFTALRPKADTDKYGYFSLGGSFGFENFVQAWNQGGFSKYFLNSVLITVPTVLLTLLFASMMAFAVSRVNWKFNITLLIMFTAGNLLPPQVLAAPLFEMFKHVTLPYSFSDSGNLLNTYIAVIIVDTAFQIGFCTFVLSNYMKALSADLTEAALVDGAGIWRQYWNIILPLCRPALAALGTLEVIFIYNDFFWPLLFIQSGDRLPITTAINNLQGQFLSNYNLIAAGAMITLIPTLLIYLVLQRQFVAGLTLGSSKG
ncbi:ABC transporter permease [Arthrobacter sp. StoSoilA2]|uniref:carbohydrate ABC transporter permease n=1 Tax=unclassified Arthrobacter TaxID=235627 RepID=UPI001CC425D9|nr:MULTISPECIES: carbohydrate ABC transporter permease [unclassified Arthrobacter]MDR6685627.1 multiple sugar transport system permease protein [Arthrobacter sp. 1088]BCW34996.1 ABC transporter permease [Arthrobacter sp. StoSoilA2]